MPNVLSRTTEISRPIGSPLVAGVKRAWTVAVAALAVLREAWAEAREMQRAAHRRYPRVGE